MQRIALSVVIALALGTGSCGSDGESGPGASGLEKSKRWSGLSNEERGALCDWASLEYFGGYGMTMDCGASSTANQQACIESVPATCNATVAEMETCLARFVCPTPLEGLNCLLAACA
jgi:hypothetical protein